MEGRTVTIPGTPRLVADVYEPAGDARMAVLWVHGFASTRSGDKAVHLGRTLSDSGVAFIAPDLQGHGESGGRLEEISVARSIEDVRRVAELPAYRDAPRRALAGSSFGGLVAAWAAAEQPELCERLVLVAPAFGFVDRYLATVPTPVVDAWRTGVPLPIKTDWLEVQLDNHLLLDWDARATESLAERLRPPTLIVHGTNDESVPVGESERFAELCGAPVELLLVDGAEHGLNEHLDWLVDKVSAFLT